MRVLKWVLGSFESFFGALLGRFRGDFNIFIFNFKIICFMSSFFMFYVSISKAKMQGVTNWLKRNKGGEGNAEAEAPRGYVRAGYLVKYLAFQCRKSKADILI